MTDSAIAADVKGHFAGVYASVDLRLRLRQEGGDLVGDLEYGGQVYTLHANVQDGVAVGSADGENWHFSLTQEDTGDLTFKADWKTASLKKLVIADFADTWKSDRVVIEIRNENALYAGQIGFDGQEYPFTANLDMDRLTGRFRIADEDQAFTLKQGLEAGLVVFHTKEIDETLSNDALREASAKWLLGIAGKPFVVPELGMKFVWLKPGRFKLDSYTFQDQQRETVLTRGYWCGVYEVTQGEWEAMMGNNPSTFKGDRLPVETVSWAEAMSFCTKLSARERASGRLPAGYAYRLPTEAEWEYACRGGTTGDFAGKLDDYGWYEDNSGSKPHDVGGKRANEWGLYDMHGNVFEWCRDWYDEYPAVRMTDPVGPVLGEDRIIRGGCWRSPPSDCRSGFRATQGIMSMSRNWGFRVVLASSR